MKKTFIITLLYLSLIFVPISSIYAVEVELLQPTVLGTGAPATPTFAEYAQKAFIQILVVAAVLAVLMIVIGGIQYIASFTSSSKGAGKEKITYAIGGLILALAAWLILNTINGSLTDLSGVTTLEGVPAPAAYNGPDYGPNGNPNNWGKCTEYGYTNCAWSGSSCPSGKEVVTPNTACPYPGTDQPSATDLCCGTSIPPEQQTHYLVITRDSTRCYRNQYPDLASCTTALQSETDTTKRCMGASEFSTQIVRIRGCSAEDTGSGWTWQYGIRDQLEKDASQQVTDMLNCLKDKVTKSDYEVSSISDNHHISRLNECTSLEIPRCDKYGNPANCCYHSRSSCHYGNNNDNKSHAIDIVPNGARGLSAPGPEDVVTRGNTLRNAASQCGAKRVRWQESGHYNHVHIDVSDATNCGGN